MIREEEKELRVDAPAPMTRLPEAQEADAPTISQADLPEGVKITAAEPITDRKSIFIGRACKISHPSQVGKLLRRRC